MSNGNRKIDSKGADLEMIRNGIKVLFAPGQVVEVRALGKYTTSGYFDDLSALAEAIKHLSDSGHYEGVYYTLNPCNPALLARRSKNKLHECPQTTTNDAEITKRLWLPIDCDPRRPKGISSTKEELMEGLVVGAGVAGPRRRKERQWLSWGISNRRAK
jgi:hypothetical protein